MEAIPPNPTETLDHQPASNNHNPPESLVSDYKDPSPPPSQTLASHAAAENGTPADASKAVALLISENGLTNTQSGTTDREVSLSGGEEETTSRRRRRSRWDPQPESESQGDESGSGKRKRKSRWAAEDPKPVVQLPDFMGCMYRIRSRDSSFE
ncbi:hypothetical protein ACLB2K_075909 [Fragaria x ananassa]